MANISEIAKGITFFIFGSIFFYYYWDLVFVNILNLTTGDLSHSLIGSISWISFILLYIVSCPLYLVYAIIAGSRNDVETQPFEILKGIGVWIVAMPAIVLIYSVLAILIPELVGVGQLDSGANNNFNLFSWFIVLIGIVGVTIIPFVYILKGYGQNIGVEMKELLKVKGGEDE